MEEIRISEETAKELEENLQEIEDKNVVSQEELDKVLSPKG